MHVIFSQLSGLIGLFIFLNQLWSYSPVDNAIFTAAGAALGLYAVLLAGDFVVRQIVSQRPPALAAIGRKQSSATSAPRPAPAVTETSDINEAAGVPAA